jgi:DNA-directed RNA polymerase specialized sigma subunit
MRYAGSRVDRSLPPVADRAEEKLRFIKRLGDGFQPVEVDILVLRYVYDEQFSEIAKELRLLGTETVIRLHDEALKKLKKRMTK